MESKDIMELIDRLMAANDQVTELMCKASVVRQLMFDAQEKEAFYCVSYRDKSDWNLDKASVLVTDLQKVFGFFDSPKATKLLKGEEDGQNT